VPKLQAAEFVWDSLGPTLARGSSAVVFQASVEGRPQALRCYIREDASSRDRYSALDAYLAGHDLSPYVSGTTWLDGAITVNRAPWPVLTMDWIDGRTLNEYVDFLVAGSNAAALTTLAGRWRELVALLLHRALGLPALVHGIAAQGDDAERDDAERLRHGASREVLLLLEEERVVEVDLLGHEATRSSRSAAPIMCSR